MISSRAGSALLERESGVVGRSIMLVDDDPIFRHFTSLVLRKEGYFVIEAEHGLDGLQKLREEVPDLIVCDISMPILDGIEFAEEVSWEYPEIPMVVVSATDDMSDVARALRFGIKDFLAKPITAPEHLTSAISNILEDEQHHSGSPRDFASQWFRMDGSGDIPDDKELHWHLEHLRNNPSEARNLLTALLPDRDTAQGNWHCSYNLLHTSESMPLVFDYAWLMDGQFAFYLVDSSEEGGCGVAAALLVRALFNDRLRNQELSREKLKEFAEIVERGIGCLDCVSSVGAMIGIADMTDGTVTLFPAGLEAIWTEGANKVHVRGGAHLGDGCGDNPVVENLRLGQGGKLNIANIGVGHFGLEIRPLGGNA